MLGSKVGSTGAAGPQAESTSAAKASIVTHAVILVLVFILDQLPFNLVKLLYPTAKTGYRFMSRRNIKI
jgi:hypothetical protein